MSSSNQIHESSAAGQWTADLRLSRNGMRSTLVPSTKSRLPLNSRTRALLLFLPLVTELHRWSDRRKLVQLPLFSCYTFLHMPFVPELWAKVLRVSGVLSFVGVRGQGVPIPEKQIESIRTLLGIMLRTRSAHSSKLVNTCGFGEESSTALKESWSPATETARW